MFVPATDRQSRSVGTILGCFVGTMIEFVSETMESNYHLATGDALGAPFESWTAQAIRKECGQVKDMKSGIHLGVGISGGAR